MTHQDDGRRDGMTAFDSQHRRALSLWGGIDDDDDDVIEVANNDKKKHP